MGPALLIERAWAGLACRDGTKRPSTPHGVLDATADPARLTAWWRRHPRDNPAVAAGASGLVVVDLDRHGDVDGVVNFRRLSEAHGELPRTFMVATPSGRHLYLGGTCRSSAGRLGPGIDIKSLGGYVLAPDSMIGGRRYRVLDDGPVAGCPDWLLSLTVSVCKAPRPPAPMAPVSSTRQHRWAAAALRAETARVVAAPVGQRNATLYTAALKLGSVAAGGGLDLDELVAALTTAAAACGLGADETTATIRSGTSVGLRNPRRPR